MNARHHTRLLITMTTIALVASAATACSGTTETTSSLTSSDNSGYPVTVESCDVSTTYDKAPSKVLLGAPGIIDTLDALDVADAAIGYALSDYATDESTDFPNLTENTADWTPSKEYLIGSGTDLFIANDEQQLTGDGAASVDDLTEMGAGLYVLDSYCVDGPGTSTIDAIYDDVEQLGAIFGVQNKASAVVDDLKSRVAKATALTEGSHPTVAAVSVADGTVYALTGASYQAVLDTLGFKNAFSDAGANYTEVTKEDVIASNPDIILVDYTGSEDTAISDAKTLFASSAAVENDQVFGWNEADFQAGGIHIVDVVEQTAKDASAN